MHERFLARWYWLDRDPWGRGQVLRRRPALPADRQGIHRRLQIRRDDSHNELEEVQDQHGVMVIPVFHEEAELRFLGPGWRKPGWNPPIQGMQVHTEDESKSQNG